MIHDLIHHITKHNLTEGQTPCEAPSFSPSLRTTSSLPTDCQSAPYGLNFLRYAAFLLLLIVVGVNGVKAEEPVEITTADDITNGTKKLYLIQTNQFQSFYMIPKNDKVTTVNLPNDQMLWYFEDAGKEGDIQYYYIVSNRNSTKKYICNSSGRSIDLVVKNTSNDEKCKFKLVEDDSNGTEGFYNIDAKAPQSSGNYALNKQGGSVSSKNPIRTTGDSYVHDYSSKWKFIRYNGTFNFPNPLSPFALSTTTEKHYFKIRNKQNTAFYMSTNSSNPQMVTYANTGNDGMVWYFKEAGSDGWFKYYYIINQEADDQYMYYEGTTDGNGMTENAVSLKAKSSENEDRFQFVIVQAAKVDKSNGDKPLECYTIIPKSLKGILWNSNSLGSSSISNDNTMGIIEGRVTEVNDNNNSHWTFESIDPCAEPTIAFDETTKKVTLSSTTAGSSIHYTTTGENPTRDSYLYENGIDLTEDASTTIKAVTVKNGNARSNVVTKTFIYMPTITLAGGPFIYDGSPKTPSISVEVGETPVSAEDYDISYENNTNAGTATVTIREKTDNETIIYGTVDFTIAKADINPVVSITGWTYGTPNDPSISGNTGNGTVTYQYKVKGAGDETYSGEKPENAGTYLVKAVIAESTNYNGATTEPVEFTISKADINPTVSITGWSYGSTPNSPSVSENPGSGTVTYKYKVKDADDATYTTEVPTEVGNYTVQATIAETDNYNGKTVSADFTISKASFVLTVSIDGWTYGGTAAAPSVSGNTSGGTVTYLYKVKDAEDNTYTSEVPTNAGNYTIKATVAASGNYGQVEATADFTIAQAALTITAEAKSKTYGEADPELTYTSEGLINDDAITGSLTREAGENAGDYAILQGDLTAGNNYAIAYTGANLTITKVGLTITANNNTITYGDAPAGNGITCEGFVNSETASVLSGTVGYDFSYKQFDNVGNTYTITPKGLTSDNYEITFVDGTLTVNKKEVGLTWSETTSFLYDGTSHCLTATATGWVHNDAISVTVTGAQTNAGNHTATASALTGNKAGNYKLPTTNTQSFTITPKSLVDGTTLADVYTLDFGENNTILLTDKDIGSALVLDTDYSVSADSDNSPQFSQRTVTGKGNYTGSFDVRNVVISFTTDIDQEEWSATFAAENSDVFNIGIGLALPEGVSAFIISGIQGDWAIPEPLNYIPKGVPVLLVAHKEINGFVPTIAASGNITPITDTQRWKNMLEVVTTESVHFNTKEIYVLFKNEFVFNKDGDMPKGKVYLNPNHTAPSSSPSPDPAPARLKIAWNYTTGIKDGRWKVDDGRSERWYTLDGRCLSGKPTTKGLYIVNGKKVVIK